MATKKTSAKAKIDWQCPFDILRHTNNTDVLKYNIRKFVAKGQIAFITKLACGEEGGFFAQKLEWLIKLFANMPYSYQQEKNPIVNGDPIVYAHYFKGGMDYYLCEKDVDSDGEGQVQAFGLIYHVGNDAELGYFSIAELLNHNFEIDLHWEPKRVSEIKKELR